MGIETGVDWAQMTWNPWRGCEKVSPGCDHCYMFREQRQYGNDPGVVVRASKDTFRLPLARKVASGRRIFTCSWSDFFHNDADPWRDEAWEIIRHTPQHTYMILTKRHGRIARCLPQDWGNGYPNVWLGVSAENQEWADRRIPVLLDTPARLRFVSCEPMLGPLELSSYLRRADVLVHDEPEWDGDIVEQRAAIGWVIAGGESGGPPQRALVGASAQYGKWFPTTQGLAWARSLLDQCVRTATPFFWKQWGGPNSKSGGHLIDGQEWRQIPVP